LRFGMSRTSERCVPYESAKIYSVHVVAGCHDIARGRQTHTSISRSRDRAFPSMIAYPDSTESARWISARARAVRRSKRRSERLTSARQKSWSCLTLRGSRGVCEVYMRIVCACVCVYVYAYTRERRSHDWTGSQRRVSLLSARSYIFTFQRRRTTGG